MLINISLVLALCSNLPMSQVKARLAALETANPGAKVTLRVDKKLSCDAKGNPVRKAKKDKGQDPVNYDGQG